MSEKIPGASQTNTATVENIDNSESAADYALSKVVDIAEFNKFGFHTLYIVDNTKGDEEGELHALEKVLKNGILGFNNAADREGKPKMDLNDKVWKQQTKKRLENPIYFGINRSVNEGIPSRIKKGLLKDEPLRISIVFDFSKFKEKFSETEIEEIVHKQYPHEGEGGGKKSYPYNSMVSGLPNQPMYNKDGLEAPQRALNQTQFQENMDKGFFQPHYEFLAYSRVPPRFLKGICISVGDTKKDEVVKKIVDVMLETYRDKKDRMLPIYDGEGNLLWPRQILHRDIVGKQAEEHSKN